MSAARPRREPTPARVPTGEQGAPRTPEQALKRIASLTLGIMIVAASVGFYWMSLGSDPLPPSRSSVVMREPVQQVLSDGYVLGARFVFDLAPNSPLIAERDGTLTYMPNARQVARIKNIAEGYLAARGREAVTGEGLRRSRADILQQLNAQGLGIRALKFSDLTVVPPGGTWLLGG